jgi:hypothetical protein
LALQIDRARMSERRKLERRKGAESGSFWVQRLAGRQAEILGIKASCDRGKKDTIVIIEDLAPDVYGLLILAPEIALVSGWLGGDRVVGRAAIRDLLNKAARFNEDERQRLTIHLPTRALTLRLDEIERYYAA